MTGTNPSAFGGRLLIGATAVATLPMYINALRTAFTGTVTAPPPAGPDTPRRFPPGRPGRGPSPSSCCR
ncbi:hypothetical protein GCM10010207_74510 [Streptomyces atratus]|nr:hypothetical protein GCM10010207_74510 [Streptomyces atratus]